MGNEKLPRRPVARVGETEDGRGVSEAEQDQAARNRRTSKEVLTIERKVLRKAGCWNCVHFGTPEINTKRKTELKLTEMRRNIMAGLSFDDAKARTDSADFLMPTLGVCLKGKAGTDLVQHTYLCETWTGKVNPYSTPGEKRDDLPHELLDKLGEGHNE